MSTAALIGKAVYTGTNGSNGNVVVAVAAYPSDTVSGAIGKAVAPAAITSAGGTTGQPVYYGGANAYNGNVSAARPAAGSLGTQGAVASPTPGPTYNPGS